MAGGSDVEVTDEMYLEHTETASVATTDSEEQNDQNGTQGGSGLTEETIDG